MVRTRERGLRDGRLLPVVSALLLALSFPPLHPLVLPFVGLVPLVVWLDGLPAGGAGGRAAVRGGLLFGAVYFGLLFHWVPVAIVGPGSGGSGGGPGAAVGGVAFALLAFAGIVAGLAALAALFTGLLHHAMVVRRAPLWLAVPVVWTAMEWTRAHLPDTLALPWLGLGTSLTRYPELVGIAEVVGARGVTFWLAAVNGLVAGLVIRVRGRPRELRQDGRTRPAGGTGRGGWKDLPAWAAPAAWTAAVAALPMAWGVWRAGALETRPVARVAVVQPNVGGRVKVGAGRAPLTAPLARLTARLDSGGVDLVVLPEGAVRTFPRSEAGSRAIAPIREASRALGAPILFGGLGFVETDDRDTIPLNSAFVMEPGGLADFRYDKRRLVPVVERVPLLPGPWAPGPDDFGGYGVGRGRPLARVGGASYGVLICYESSYPEEARAHRLAGADVLVNVTNDAWFGGEPSLFRTTALWQHPAHLVMRAVENRMGVVRSANTGISLFVDPLGRVAERTGLFTEDVLVTRVRSTDVVTFYTRHGDVVGNASALVTLGLLLLALDARRRGRRTVRPPMRV